MDWDSSEMGSNLRKAEALLVKARLAVEQLEKRRDARVYEDLVSLEDQLGELI
jgi:hypothetical protein